MPMPAPRRPSELDRLRLVARIAARMHEEAALDTLLQGTADAMHEMLGYPNVDIPMLDPEEPYTLVVAVRGGHYKRAIRHVDRIPVDRGIMGAVMRSRRTEDRVTSTPHFSQTMPLYRGFLYLPQ